jgi:hypothetical protein
MWEWTRKGAPIIVEVGPKDLDKNALMFRNRIYISDKDGWKNFEGFDEFVNSISDKLQNIQGEMLNRASNRLKNNIVTSIKTPEEFNEYFKNSNVFLENNGKAPKVAFVKGGNIFGGLLCHNNYFISCITHNIPSKFGSNIIIAQKCVFFNGNKRIYCI